MARRWDRGPGRLAVFVDKAKVNEVRPGELFGEASAFLSFGPRTASIRAMEASEVRFCSKDAIARMRGSSPARYDALLDRALTALAQRVFRSHKRIAQLAEGFEARPDATVAEVASPSPAQRRLEHHLARLALRTLPSLAGLDDAALDALASGMRSRTLEAGDSVFVQGAEENSVFLLADGEVDVLRNIGSERAVKVGSVDRPSLFGLLGLLLGKPRDASVVAASPGLVLEMSRSAHADLPPDVRRAWRETLLMALREHIQNADRNVVQLGARRAARIQRSYQYAGALTAVGSGVVWPIVESSESRAVREKTDEILRILAPHRRLLADVGTCAAEPCADCWAIHRPKVERAVATESPLHFILPAFPAKSPNTDTKVLGKLPDMAEEQSLRYLQTLCEDFRKVWEPGARVTICSDGRVFSDLVLVSDDDISEYARAIEAMLDELNLADIDTFNLEDLFEVSSFAGMRDHLATHYGEPVSLLRQRAKDHAEHRSMVNGIHRFLFEDTLAVRKDLTKTQIKKETKSRAYEVVQRSNAFSRLIAECFPHALRLSIHPQPAHSAKIGVLLGMAESTWITPWHGVSMHTTDGWRLVKRERAEHLGAALIHRQGRPSHYVLEA